MADDRFLLGFGLGLIVATSLTRCAAPARADDDPGLRLARVLTAEAGLFSTADHRAMVGVFRVRAARAGVSLVDMALQYSTAQRGQPTAWPFRMRRGMEQRPAWLPGGAWAPRRAAWQRLLALADAATARPLPTPCPGATHFAAPWYQAHPSLRRVTCTARTLNAYYR